MHAEYREVEELAGNYQECAERYCQIRQAAFLTLPLRMQDVQTRMRLVAPLMTARTVCKFKFQRRLETLWAWLMRCPNMGPRPQTSQTLAMGTKISFDGKLQF
jgi:hypothetical protein